MKKGGVLRLQLLLSFFFIFGASADDTKSEPVLFNQSHELKHFSSPDVKKKTRYVDVHSLSKEEYLKERKLLIFEDEKINFSRNIKLNKDEQKLSVLINGIVDDLQKQFADSSLFCPAGNFFTAKNVLKSRYYFQFFRGCQRVV